MSLFAFEYADVSDDPNARFWADVPGDLRRELARLEFEPLGYAHAFQRRSKAHLVHEVQVSSDARTQAVLNAYAPRVELVTLFEDGSIVKTQQRPPTSTWVLLAPGMRGHPDDRLYFESVAGDARSMLLRHEERILEREQSQRVSPVPMDSMLAHFAVRVRAAELLNARFPTQFTLSIVLAVGSQLVAAVVIMRIAFVRFGPHASRLWIAILAALGGTIAMLGVFQVTLYWLAPWLLRLRRGPPCSPATLLLERAASIPRRALPTDW